MKDSSTSAIAEQGYAVGILCVDDGRIVAVASQGLSLESAEQDRCRLRRLQAVVLPPGHRMNPGAR
jgi:hypothetical protein